MYKVLVTSRSFGQTSDLPVNTLKDEGIEIIHIGNNMELAHFEELVKGCDAVILGVHPFRTEVLKECTRLRIIAKHGAGLDNIDLEKAKEMGIVVTNVPAMNANAVADLAFGHMLNLSRGISLCDRRVHTGEWKTYTGRDVYRKKLGLIGFGAIAKNVAKRADGFSMQVLAFDPFIKEVPEAMSGYVTLTDFETVLAESDIISIHVPLTEETRNLFNYETMGRMKKESYLVNTGRGGIINEADLYRVLVEKRILGAAMDVMEHEPVQSDNPLLTLDNVVMTPHIGMYSKEAINAVGQMCADNVVKVLKGQEPDCRVV